MSTGTTQTTSGPKKAGDAAAPPPPPRPLIDEDNHPEDFPFPDDVVYFKDPEEDSLGIKAVLELFFAPHTFFVLWDSIRVIAFIALPMFVIGTHPNTRARLRYPQMLLATAITVATHRETLGEEIGKRLWVLTAVAAMVPVAVVCDALNVAQHTGAWYGLLAAALVGASLCRHGPIRSYLYMCFFISAMLTRIVSTSVNPVAPQRVPVTTSCWLALDIVIGCGIAIAANVLPFPILASRETDAVFCGMFGGLAQILSGMHTLVAPRHVLQASVFYLDRSIFDQLQAVHTTRLPALLWAVSFEPWEYPLRNPVRRLKLSLWRRVMALTYAAFSTGRTVAEARRVQLQARAIIAQWDATAAAAAAATADGEKGADGAKGGHNDPSQDAAKRGAPSRLGGTTSEETGSSGAAAAAGEPELVDACLEAYHHDFGVALTQALRQLGACGSTPEAILRGVDFDGLRTAHHNFSRHAHMRLLGILQRRTAAASLAHRDGADDSSASASSDGDSDSAGGGSSDPDSSATEAFSDVVIRTPHQNDAKRGGSTGGASGGASAQERTREVPAAPQPKKVKKDKPSKKSKRSGGGGDGAPADSGADALVALDVEGITDNVDLYLLLKEHHFHMLLSFIVMEILSFEERMMHYAPPESFCSRVLRDLRAPFRRFWHGLLHACVFRTPQDWRVLKDAVKMTVGFLTVASFNFEIFPIAQGMSQLGVTVLFGIPCGEESMRASIGRLAGVSIGCSYSYLAVHNTKNRSEMIGCSFCFMFLSYIFRRHGTFGSAFLYSVVTTLVYNETVDNVLVLLMRFATTCNVVLIHLVVIYIIFPNNPIKILWGYRARFAKNASELIDDLAMTLRLPLASEEGQDDEAKARSSDGGSSTEPFAPEADDGGSGSDKRKTRPRLLPPQPAVTAMLSQMSLELRLLHNLEEMNTKWCDIVLRDTHVLRGMEHFPVGASHQVSLCMIRIVSSLRLLLFSVELLHRPRAQPVEPALAAIVHGPLAELITGFATGSRVFFQDVIDALQASQTWALPTALSHINSLVALRADIRGRLLQWTVALRGQLLAGVVPLQAQERRGLEEVRRDHERRRQRESAAHGPDSVEGGGDDTSTATAAREQVADGFLTARVARAYEERRRRERRGKDKGAKEEKQQEEEEEEVAPASHEPDSEEPQTLGAPLREAFGKYDDMYPFTQESAEADVRALLLHQLETETEEEAAASARHSSVWRPSRLILDPAVGPEPRLPAFHGAHFHFHVDPTALPTDTDFCAVLTAVNTCGNLLYEMERLLNAMHALNGFQRDAHDFSFIAKLISKLAPAIADYRRGIAQRFAVPPPGDVSRINPPPPSSTSS